MPTITVTREDEIIRANEQAEAKRLTEEVIAKKKAMMKECKSRPKEVKKQVRDIVVTEISNKPRKKPSLFDLLDSGRC